MRKIQISLCILRVRNRGKCIALQFLLFLADDNKKTWLNITKKDNRKNPKPTISLTNRFHYNPVLLFQSYFHLIVNSAMKCKFSCRIKFTFFLQSINTNSNLPKPSVCVTIRCKIVPFSTKSDHKNKRTNINIRVFFSSWSEVFDTILITMSINIEIQLRDPKSIV